MNQTVDTCDECERLFGERTVVTDRMVQTAATGDNNQWQPEFSRWRHGGWYVDNLQYPSGAIGCVSNNYPDKKWRIVCDPRPFAEQPTFANRVAAAHGERELIARAAERSGEQ